MCPVVSARVMGVESRQPMSAEPPPVPVQREHTTVLAGH